MSAPISEDDVAHVARLARLAVTPDELRTFTGQLAAVLDHASDIEALDLGEIKPMTHPYDLVNVVRPDHVGTPTDRSAVLAQAPDTDEGQFAVPAILGEEG